MDTTSWTLIVVGAAIVLAILLVLMLRGRRSPAIEAVVEPETLVEPEPVALPEADGPPDPLTTLKGLGPRAAARLGELGVTRYDQLGALNDAQVATIDAQMGTFAGRIQRDRWVEQARLLAAGDIPAFEAEFGKLG